jgi:drug/metabolite transporter (DMT)-like permease
VSPNTRGAVLMSASMAGFAVEDMLIKAAAKTVPTGQIVVTMGVFGVLVFGVLARAAGEPLLPRLFLAPAMLVRSGFEIGGRLFYTLAITLTPLATASAILQATPLLVIAGAALIFGERVGWRRWTAVAVGFAGVLMILRPGLEGFSPLSLLAVAGLIGFAGRDLATRAAPKGLSNRQLGLLGFVMLGVAGGVILAFEGGARWPDLREAGLIAGACLFAVIGYHALTAAMRTGEVGAVTPFRYTRLVFALILAVLVFGERPDALTLSGAAIIVAAGIYGLLRTNHGVKR